MNTRSSTMVPTAVLAAVGALATGIGFVVGWWVRSRKRHEVDDDGHDLVRSFLTSSWVETGEAASPSDVEEVARALHVHANSRGKALRLWCAHMLAPALGATLAFRCPSTDLFEMFLEAETVRDPEAACALADLRIALAKFADERGVHLGRRALSRARLRARLGARGLAVDETDRVPGLACTLWA